MTFLFFFIILSILILVHEWGHFYAARKFGVRVDEFGFGFPPKIWGVVRNGTRFVFNLLPIGGYVKIYGEGGEGKEEKDSFSSRNIRQRFIIVAAGVFMNMVLAWVFFSGAHMLGIPRIASENEIVNASVTIIGVEADSPASETGLKFGDTIKSISFDNQILVVKNLEEFRSEIKNYAGKEVTLQIQRNQKERSVAITPRLNPPEGSGALGIAIEYVFIAKSSWYQAPFKGIKSVIQGTIGTFVGLFDAAKTFFIDGKTPTDLSGPVGIFIFASDIRELGISYILQFIAVISLNLAILNSLPIPALDGGRIFFMVLEKIRKKPLPIYFENTAHMIGLLLLLMLMALVTIHDIRKFL